MEFGRLNRHLLASIYPVDREGNLKGDGQVDAMVTEASMEIALGWQSPFEAMGPEAVSPTLLAMVQSGSLADLFTAMAPDVFQKTTEGFAGSVGELMASAVGRTGLTKMNSTQVFTGMPPLKISATLLFRAWSNPIAEVEAPFDTLMGWALPRCLQKDSVLTNVLGGGSPDCPVDAAGSAVGLDTLLPSVTPTMVGWTYKARTYKPLVIESVGFPMDSPSDEDGRYVELLVPVTLATWQAMDAADWSNTRTIPL